MGKETDQLKYLSKITRLAIANLEDQAIETIIEELGGNAPDADYLLKKVLIETGYSPYIDRNKNDKRKTIVAAILEQGRPQDINLIKKSVDKYALLTWVRKVSAADSKLGIQGYRAGESGFNLRRDLAWVITAVNNADFADYVLSDPALSPEDYNYNFRYNRWIHITDKDTLFTLLRTGERLGADETILQGLSEKLKLI